MGDRGKGAPRVRPAALTTTASLSATDPAIFLQSAAGARLEAGGGGRGTRRAGGDPGAVLRRAGARVRGWLGRAPPRGHARARTPGPLRRPGRPGRWGKEGRGGAGPEVGGGRGCPDGGCPVELLCASGCCWRCAQMKGAESRTAPALGGI